MTMSVTQDADAKRRWAAARSIAGGEMDARMPKRRRVTLLWISFLMVACWVIGALSALLLPPPALGAATEDDTWSARLIAASIFLLIGLVVGVVGFVWAVRTRRYITRWRAVASALSVRERRWVTKHIRSATPVEDEGKRLVVLAIAAQNRRATVGVLPLYFSTTMFALSVGISSPWIAVAWVELIGVLGLLLAFVFVARDYRRAGVYLARFGGESMAAGPAGTEP
jgi:hypothetical protein